MKRKEYLKELRELTQEGLQERIRELQEEKMRVRFRKHSTQLEEKHLIQEAKTKLAQAKTVYSQKFVAVEDASTVA